MMRGGPGSGGQNYARHNLGRHAAGVIMMFTAVDLPGVFGGPDLVRVASIWPWMIVVLAKEIDPGNLNLPAVVIIVSKPFQDDGASAA
jgi:hypothetical protein